MVFDRNDELSHVMNFVGNDFLHVAGVNRTSRESWGDSETSTCYMDENTTETQLGFALDNGLERTVAVCELSARKGLHRLLETAVRLGCPLGHSVCAAAAANGHLHVLQIARELGSAWCELTCVSAAKYGHLKVLIWCVDNYAPASDLVLLWASLNRHQHVVEWINEHPPSLVTNMVCNTESIQKTVSKK